MELTVFTAAACGNGPRQFVGEQKRYQSKSEFLNHVWKEFRLEEHYEKPSSEAVAEGFARAFTDYENNMKIESGHHYCAEIEDGSFPIYLLDEEDLKEVYKINLND